MRAGWLPIACLLLASRGTSGQETHAFRPRFQSGDTLTVNTQIAIRVRVESAEKGKTSVMVALTRMGNNSIALKVEQDVKIVEARDDRPIRVDARMKTYSGSVEGDLGFGKSEGKDAPGSLDGATIRFERIGDEFKPTLLDGDLTPAVSDALKTNRAYLFNECLLPSRPLAVGDMESAEDGKRASAILRAFNEHPGMMDITGAEFELVDKLAIKLNKVDKVDGVNMAFLTVTFAARAKDPEALGSRSASLKLEATVLYDIDHNTITAVDWHLTRKDTSSVSALGVLKEAVVVVVDCVVVDKYRRD